ALRADDDDVLVVAVDLRQGVVPGQVEAPLEHVALDDEAEAELTLGGALGGGTDGDDQTAVGTEPLELVRFDPPDVRPRPGQQVVGAVRRPRAAAASALTVLRSPSGSNSPLPSVDHATSLATNSSPASS